MPGTYSLNSVFPSPDLAQYQNYIVTTVGSGWVHEDANNRLSMTWYAGSQTGAEYRNGTFYLPASGVRVVCFENQFKIHAYPDASIIPASACSKCGAPIPYST
jgi:hypothetical protein